MHSVAECTSYCLRMHFVIERNLFCDRIILLQNAIHSVTENKMQFILSQNVTKCYTFWHRMNSANYSIFYILFFFQSHKRWSICGVFGKRMHRTRKQNGVEQQASPPPFKCWKRLTVRCYLAANHQEIVFKSWNL